MNLKTTREVELIVSSFRKIFMKEDVSYLTKSAYDFIYLSSGFIAHYNIFGFQDYYDDVEFLKRDILRNKSMNQWNNFQPNERDYDYYMQKKAIYNMIVEVAN